MYMYISEQICTGIWLVEMMGHSLLSYIGQSNATSVLHRYMYMCNEDGGVNSMYPEHDNHIFIIKKRHGSETVNVDQLWYAER